jgi:hypothetical protein
MFVLLVTGYIFAAPSTPLRDLNERAEMYPDILFEFYVLYSLGFDLGEGGILSFLCKVSARGISSCEAIEITERKLFKADLFVTELSP